MISSHEEILENLKTKIIKDESTRVLEGEIIARLHQVPFQLKQRPLKNLILRE